MVPGQPYNAREPVGGLEGSEVPAGCSQKLSRHEGSKTGHTRQHLCVLVFGDLLPDQCIEFGQFLVQGKDLPGQGCDDPLPMYWAGTTVCWDFAASTAAVATAAEERAPCFFSQAWILACPARRMPSGVRYLLSNVRAALERL